LTLPEAYTTLALIAMNYDWAWDEADRLYRHAIELNDDYATAHAWRGEYLAFMGRFDEGPPELRRDRSSIRCR
jgi:Tfp pilus assembly protein PilF